MLGISTPNKNEGKFIEDFFRISEVKINSNEYLVC